MEAAPLHAELAEGPDPGAAHWIAAADGVRLRVVHWAGGAPRGTVLLFPGRTEYAEKYGRAAADLAARGYATLTVDWRGQGLADRVHPNPRLGHVGAFPDYQQDVAALVRAAAALDLPRPYYLLAHSMGGAIGLRALHEGLEVAAAVFSAPMWGIYLNALQRPAAWAVSALSRPLGFGGRFTPGTAGEGYVLSSQFEENDLTGDAEMFDYMRRHLEAVPDLALAGPSLAWLNEALRETRTLARRPAPDYPALTFLGTAERIVCPFAIAQRMERWPGGRLHRIEGARHEMMMEGPDTRAAFFDAAAELFERHRSPPSPLRDAG